MRAGLTDTLCTQCGLCCGGTLFGDVDVTRGEALTLEVMGLDIEPDGNAGDVLVQPCLALKDRQCSIYAHRPSACRTFECLLLQRAERDEVEVEQALETIADALSQVARVRSLIASLGPIDERLSLKERCAEALAWYEAGEADPQTRQAQEALEAAMASVEYLIEEAFLGKVVSQ